MRRQNHDREFLVDQRVGAVLHLAGGIAFGVDVGNLFQLQRPFQRDREVDTAPEKQKIGGAKQLAPQLFIQRIAGKYCLQLARNVQQFLYQAARGALVQLLFGLAQVHGQDEQRRQLAGERFRGGHPDLRAGVRDDRSRRLARDHGAHNVADGERLRALLLGLALRRERVGGLSGLGDDHGQRIVGEDGIAVAEFAAVVHFHGHAGQLLDHEFAGQSGVPARAARHDPDLPEFLELLGRDIHLVEEDPPRFLSHPAQGRVPHGARLLVNLLEHEMLVAALFRHDRVPQDVRDLPVHRPPFEIAEADTFMGEHGHIAVSEEEHVARMAQNRRNVRCHEVFVVAQADHHRRPRPRRDNFVRVCFREHRQSEHAGQLFDGGANRGFQVPREVLLHQVRDDLGIGLGDELVSFFLKLLLERQVVLDDAVDHHVDVVGGVEVRVGVLLADPAVRRPAGVADAVCALDRAHADGVLQVPQFSRSPAHRKGAVVSYDRQSG